MRIAALVTQPRGGPVDHAVDVACALAARGHESVVVGPVDHYADRLRDAGVPWYDLDIRTKTDVRGARALPTLLRSLTPDVLHCQDRRAGMVGRLLARRTAARIVYSVHGVADSLSDLVAGNVRAESRRRGDRLRYVTTERLLDRLTPTEVVTVCRPVADYVRTVNRVPAERVHVVPNGIDAERFAPSAGASDGRTVLWLGLMDEVKRVDVLLRALAAVDDVRAVLVGDGPQRPELENLSHSLGISDRVDFRGYVEDPTTVFGAADAFVLPSAAEALPLALLQAMSSGLPVVASRVGGIPDVVRPGTEGFLVAPDDPRELGRAITDLLGDDEARRALGKRARERVLDAYTLDHCVDGLLGVYAP